ncbi:MAG: bifunctional metallophosphatase/5'-nucleotidase, partial [Candidatus Adiutrix sp.]|nr:bifunctional metallophosphatase/5'-nucleotidase [Candidatus Adiutrix sp.]
MSYLWKLLGVALILLTAGNAAAADHDLVIYHTNDVHGYAFEERDADGKLTRVGYDRLKALIDDDETECKLLLDAGDVLHGQAFATARRGELAAQILNMMGYDALAVGNHEFDYGADRLEYLVSKYRLNFLAANVLKADNPLSKWPKYFLPSSTLHPLNNLKAGIFSLSTPETPTSTDPRNVLELTFEDPIATAKNTAARLRAEGASVVIALTHLGSEDYCQPSSLTLAAEVPGLDLIVDGHSHSALAKRVKRPDGGETLVVSSGSGFENVGRVYADRSEGGWTFSAELLPAADISYIAPDPAMSRAMAALREELDAELAQVVMEAPFALDGSRENIRNRSTNLGRIVSAALMSGTADAALINSGSFRDSIAAGPVTKGQLLSVLPYGNYVYVIDISGADLLAALNHGLARPGSGAFPQFFGMTVEAAPLPTIPGALKATAVTIGGRPLDPTATYRLATNDFLHSGGDGYKMFSKYEAQELSTLEEIFRNFITEIPAE